MNLAQVLLQSNGDFGVESNLRETLERSRRVLGNDHEITHHLINNLSMNLRNQGRYSEALVFMQEALEGYRSRLGDDHHDTLLMQNNLGNLLSDLGRQNEAEKTLRDAVERGRNHLGPQDPLTLSAASDLASVFRQLGRLSDAEQYARDALKVQRQVLGDHHEDTLNTIQLIATVLTEQDRFEEASTYAREALDGFRRTVGDSSRDTIFAVASAGTILQRQSKFPEAKEHLVQVVDRSCQLFGEDDPSTLTYKTLLGGLYFDLRDFDEALNIAAETRQKGRAVLAPGDRRLGLILLLHGKSLTALEQYSEAAESLNEAYGILFSYGGLKNNQTIQATSALIKLFGAWHTAEPDKGYDVKAAEWKAKLDALAQPVENPIPENKK